MPNRLLQGKVETMCRALQHGGPDDEGIFMHTDPALCFGHRRLSIIDLSANGHQPMADARKLAWITFNGEIYNYTELRQELHKLGARFITATDTEVILQAYLNWGQAAFARLRGMFAFALYDTVQQLSYLVRDESGIKPLYYCAESQQLSFASEVRALQQAGIAKAADDAWKINFLAYGHIPEPYTTLKNVFSLPKGSYLCWHHNSGKFTIKEFTSAPRTPLITNADEARQLIAGSLQKAVKRQLISDAPAGVFLSGGIDSSLLSLLANAVQGKQAMQYISIYFNEEQYSEQQYQHLIGQQLSGRQHAYLVTQNDFETCLPEVISSMDMPTTDGINTWFISKYASQSGLKTVLSGLGADELFGGYPSFKRIKYINYLKRLPSKLLNRLAGLSNTGYKRLSFLTVNHPLAEYLFLRGIYTPAEIAGLLSISVRQVEDALFSRPVSVPEDMTGAAKAGWLETNFYMQNQLLRDTDIMSMSHGLEVRVPYLDEDFTAAVKSIVPALRFSSPPVKKMLAESFKGLLPGAISNRPKMGFSFPLQQWMNIHPEIGNEDFYTSKPAKKIIGQFKAGQLHWSKAFALYQLQHHA